METTTRKIVYVSLPIVAILYGSASWGVPFVAILWPAIFDPHSGLVRCIQEGETRSLITQALFETVKISGLVTIICMSLSFFGVALTHALAPRLFRVMFITAVFTVWINPVVRIFAWLVLMQPKSPIGQAVHALIPDANEYAFLSVVVGMCSFLFPFALLSVGAAASRIGLERIQLAQVLRLSFLRTCLNVYLPALRSAVLLGGCLVFLLSLGYYITPQILGGGRIITASTVIAHLWLEVGSVNVSAFLALILLLLSAIPMIAIWKDMQLGAS